MNKFKALISRIKSWVKKNKRRTVFIAVGCFLVFMFVDEALADASKPDTVTYNEFVQQLKDGSVDTVYYSNNDEQMRYTLYNSETTDMSDEDLEDYTYPDEDWRMVTYPANQDFRKEMLEYDAKVVIKSFAPLCESILGIGVSLAIPLLIVYAIYKMLTGGVGNLDDDVIKSTNVKFSDVIGHGEVIKDLQFVVELLKNRSLGKELNVAIPRGMLFTGDPGTGKTLLAKAVAGESGVPFLYMNASSFIELYVGTGAKRVRQLFKKAREISPCIVFIDEIDAVGMRRGRQNTSSEDHQTINALLQEMDGFDSRSGVFIIAATNNVTSLDKALTRAGRFDRQIEISPPKDWSVRKDIFEHYLKDVKNSVDIEAISRQCVGFTGADISAVVNEAKIIAVMHSSDEVTTGDVEEAIDKRMFKGNRVQNSEKTKDNTIVAYHEAGHAVMAYICNKPLARASIVGTTSGVGGMVIQNENPSQFTTKSELISQVMIAYAGRCSERVKFGDVTTGATNDITMATRIISAFVQKYGFDENMGMLDFELLQNGAIVDAQATLSLMSKMAKQLESATDVVLQNNYKLVEVIATNLMRYETLSGSEISNLLQGEVVTAVSECINSVKEGNE